MAGQGYNPRFSKEKREITEKTLEMNKITGQKKICQAKEYIR
jgi:hypothetical protein